MAVIYRPLAYTTPQTGQRIEFTYDGAINDGVTHNLGSFNFSGVDGTFHQDKSLTTEDYTFTVFVNNQDDLKLLRSALNEKRTDTNTGTLEHPDPTLGTFPVVISSYSMAQNSVKKSGVIAVTITFLKTITNLLGGDPSETLNPSSASSFLSALDELNLSQAIDFANSVVNETGASLSALSNRVTDFVNDVTSGLDSLSRLSSSIYTEFTNLSAEIKNNIDTLVTTPFNLARQIQNLVQLPMLATDNADIRITAYISLYKKSLIFDASDETEFTNGTGAGVNILAAAGLNSLTSISAINYSAISTPSVTLDDIISSDNDIENLPGYLSRPKIIDTINSVIESAQETAETLSEKASNFNAETFFTQYFDYSILSKTIVSKTVKNLNKRVFDTSKEVTIITDRELTPIQHCADLYQSLELNTLNFFIQSNNLRGDEIYIVPKNREIVYYV